MKYLSSFVVALALVSFASVARAKLITVPLSSKANDFNDASVSTFLGNTIAPELEAAITKACGSNYLIKKLDTHIVAHQGGCDLMPYEISGSVICEVPE